MALPLFDSRYNLAYFGLTSQKTAAQLGCYEDMSLNLDRELSEVYEHCGFIIERLKTNIPMFLILRLMLISPDTKVFFSPIFDEYNFRRGNTPSKLGWKPTASRWVRTRFIQEFDYKSMYAEPVRVSYNTYKKLLLLAQEGLNVYT